MEQVFQALIDRSRAPLDLKTIKTILGDKGRPKYRPRNMRAAQWQVAVERPTYDLTVFKLHCGKLTLKIYSKGERVLRIEAVARNIRELRCGRLLDNFPWIVCRLKNMLENFMEALRLSCIDQCFIGDEMLERLPLPVRVGKSVVGGIDLNKPRLRHVAEAVVALSASPDGFTASALAAQVRARQSKRLRSPPNSLRSEETPRQINRPPDRFHSSLRDPSVRFAGDHGPARAPRQSYQTAARRRSGNHPHPWRTKPTNHRSPLP
jgi:hypothetical protein